MVTILDRIHVVVQCATENFQRSVQWPLVRRALDEIRYNGWLTIEDSELTVTENSRRLDLIIAGR